MFYILTLLDSILILLIFDIANLISNLYIHHYHHPKLISKNSELIFLYTYTNFCLDLNMLNKNYICEEQKFD